VRAKIFEMVDEGYIWISIAVRGPKIIHVSFYVVLFSFFVIVYVSRPRFTCSCLFSAICRISTFEFGDKFTPDGRVKYVPSGSFIASLFLNRPYSYEMSKSEPLRMVGTETT
jgi:hypothetical protein